MFSQIWHRQKSDVAMQGRVYVLVAAICLIAILIIIGCVLFGTFVLGATFSIAYSLVSGLIVGALARLACYLFFQSKPDLSGYGFVQVMFGEVTDWSPWAKSLAAIASTAGALIGTPAVTLCFRRQAETPAMQQIREAFAASRDEEEDGQGFGLKPKSTGGRIGLALLAIGFVVFLGGVLSAGVGFGGASQAAVGGMLIFFAGGLTRVYSD